MTDRRGFLGVGVVVGVVATAAALVAWLPEQWFVMLFGEVVNHCPDSEFSCSSHRPGLLHIPFAIVVLYMILADADGDES